MKKIWVWLGVCCLVLVGAGCQKEEPVSYTGVIEGQEIAIRSESSGVIKELSKNVGDRVEVNDKVAQLNDDLHLLQIEEAQAVVDAATAKLDEVKEHGSDTAIRQAEANLKQAESKLGQVRLQQSKTTITSPENGVILQRHVEKGEVIQPGTLLYSVLKQEDLQVTIYVPETQLGQIYVGKPMTTTVDAYPGQYFMGEIIQIGNQAEFTPKNVHNPDERTKVVFAVTIKLTGSYDKLKPGMPADVSP